MADNVAITAGVGTSIATDDISGVQYQRVKLGLGGDGIFRELQPVTVTAATQGTGDVTIASSSAILFGVWACSTSGAAAEVFIRDSTTSTGKVVWGAVFDGSTGERNQSLWFGPQGLRLTNGIRVDRTAGNSRLSLYYISPA